MFYSKCLLSRKGSLGVIWVAAYCFKRLKKSQVYTTDISSTVDEILKKQLDVMAYRVLAYLLFGLVRIYSKKVEYLCDDCHDVMIKIIDFVGSQKSKTHLKVQNTPFHTITLPDRFELDAFDLEIVEDVDRDNLLPLEEITLKDGASNFGRIGPYSLGKYPCEESSALHDTTEYSPFEDILLFQSVEIDMDGSTSHDLSNLEASLEKHHGNGSSQEEWMNLDIFCGNAGEHANSISLSGEDQNIDGGHIKVSLIAQPEHRVQGDASTENHQNNRFPGGGEEPQDLVKLHSEDNQSVGAQMKDPHLAQSEKETCEAINEDNNLSNLQASTEKLLDHRFPQEVCMDLEMDWGSEERCPELSKPSCEEHQIVQMNSMEISLSRDGKCHSMKEEDPVSNTVDATPQSKFPEASGATTPEFMVIPTPATKDCSRSLRKRKCFFDDVTVFPNNVIKQCLEDTSDLVKKRSKAPRTALSALKAIQISNLSLGFLVPLLPCTSSELSSLFCLDKSKILETVESPKPKSFPVGKSLGQIAIAPETPAGRSLEKPALAPETPTGRSLEEMAIALEETPGRSSEQQAVAPETPDHHSREKRPFETSENQKASRSDTITQAHSFQNVEKELLSSTEDQECNLTLLIEESDSSEGDSSELHHGLSARTRMVVRYLHRRFLNQKKRRENEAVNLMQLLEGKTKKASARLFYEILVLNSKGYVDVKQDDAYGDILVLEAPKWDQSCALLFP